MLPLHGRAGCGGAEAGTDSLRVKRVEGGAAGSSFAILTSLYAAVASGACQSEIASRASIGDRSEPGYTTDAAAPSTLTAVPLT